MEFNIGLDVIITLLIAIYGALLSTYSVWASRQEHKREIKVERSYGFIRNPLLQVSPPLLSARFKTLAQLRALVTFFALGQLC